MSIKLQVEIKLESDAIFSSGYSVAGGDDINVYTDVYGKPYFKGTSFKGLLRENMENIVTWLGQDNQIISILFGKESLEYVDEDRRLKFTNFVLKDNDKFNVFSNRTFTSVENGTAKEGSLRTAKIITKGLTFTGEIFCGEEDVELIKSGLLATKWIGSMKNRGFGKVLITADECKITDKEKVNDSGKFIYYRIKTKLPVQVTNFMESKDGNYKTYPYITGSIMRGLVLNNLAKDNQFFNANKVELLSNKTRFTNLTPHKNGYEVIPTIMGFYEHKDETGLENIVVDGSFESGKKRAKLGEFCAIDCDKIKFTSVKKSRETRIGLNKNGDNNTIFTTSHILAEQEFEGYILLENETFSNRIINSFKKEFFIGADKNEGFGKCELIEIKVVDNLKYIEKYGYSTQTELSKELYLLALSPFTMTDEAGDVCGLDEIDLSKQLGVDVAQVQYCSTSCSEYSNFNTKWMARNSIVSMYNQGCIFKITCSDIPAIEKIKNIEINGLGVRSQEGFGQVLFIRNDIINNIKSKTNLEENIDENVTSINTKRQEKIKYIMKTASLINGMKTSESQKGEIQRLCENKDIAKLNEYLEKNTSNESPQRKFIFTPMKEFIDNFIECEFKDYSTVDKLDVLCELFNYSRKILKEKA